LKPAISYTERHRAARGNVRYLRCGSAAALVLRYPGSAADVTITVTAGEYPGVPVGPGVEIVKATGTRTTTVPIHPRHAFFGADRAGQHRFASHHRHADRRADAQRLDRHLGQHADRLFVSVVAQRLPDRAG
jgi:hypothetical protein